MRMLLLLLCSKRIVILWGFVGVEKMDELKGKGVRTLPCGRHKFPGVFDTISSQINKSN